MLEFITSKVVSAVAVIILTASVLGFFAIERGALEEQQFQQMCRSLGNAMDSCSSVSAEMRLNVTFNGDRAGLRLDSSFRSKAYEIEVRTGQVIFRQEGLTAVRVLVRSVHPWDPALLGNGTAYASPGGIAGLDTEHKVFKVTSGKDFMLESKMVVVSGTPAYHTFVHL